MKSKTHVLLPVKLTAKQRRVCELLCQGECDKSLAHELKLSRSGVRSQITTLLRKFCAISRTGIAIGFERQKPNTILLDTSTKPRSPKSRTAR